MLKSYIKARETVIAFVRSEEGASLAEYALLIALVLIGAAAALGALTGAVGTALGKGTSCLTNASTSGC